MSWLGIVAAVALIIVVLIDCFEVLILPRRVRHDYRLARLFYQSAWRLWRALAKRQKAGRLRSGFLSVFGPLSLFALLSIWAYGLIAGFALLHWSMDSPLSISKTEEVTFSTFIYFSGTTFFTLGYGDLVPVGAWGRALSVLEAGIGFGFLALVIGYLPVLYQAFSRREIVISLLDARAGSPPTAGELLRRLAEGHALGSANGLLLEWERWSAEILESHLSYPVLSYYRSQHDNQSWVGALTTILDTATLLIVSKDERFSYQARLTFAMARHAAVDLAMVFRTPPRPLPSDRLDAEQFVMLGKQLTHAGLTMSRDPDVIKTFEELRGLYEPIVHALARYLCLDLPKFQPEQGFVDNWQTSPWMKRAPGLSKLTHTSAEEEHFG
ncbi:MAG TPA: potassium channel family protein [Gemmatales bacterium]|nr:potassium channel family protein [Gemmatales bacterium]